MNEFKEKCIIYKKGSLGTIKHEYDSIEYFYKLEKKARTFRPTRNDEAKRAILNIIQGKCKSMKSEYLGYDITIKIKK